MIEELAPKMVDPIGDFEDRFKKLTGFAPYRWQLHTYERMLDGRFDDLKLPTGTGKTSVMVIWLLALAKRAELSRAVGFPRRLVWVVDRRTVVDQATTQAEELRRKLEEPSLVALKRALLGLSATGSEGVIAVSTLRGELADNGEWKEDPSKPAIIVGTVDMVGSKLLFSGYGDGRWFRPLHAGLLGTDVLFVLDEAHLSAPFAELLKKIAHLNKGEAIGLPPFRLMLLSATLDGDGKEEVIKLLESEDSDYIQGVVSARKKLVLHSEEDTKGRLIDNLVDLALNIGEEKKGSRIVVYVTHPGDVLAIRNKINLKAGRETAVALTGTIRGYERDKLVDDPIFRRFLEKEDLGSETIYFVANSAGEVGIDMYADHMVGDLVPADRMIQRLGRVNRAGRGDAVIHVVKDKSKKKNMEDVLEQTWKYLGEVANDASPLEFLCNPPPKDAIERRPPYPPLHNWILDSWSFTSIDDWPSRPEVEAWLRGLEDSSPDVYFAWRDDVDVLVKLDAQKITEIFRVYPVLSGEILRESEGDAKEKIQAIAKRVPEGKAILLSYLGNVVWKGELGGLRDRITERNISLRYCTLILSTKCGGLKGGFLDPECPEPATDVSSEKKERFHGLLRLEDDRFVWEFYSGALKEFNGREFDSKRDALLAMKKNTNLEPVLVRIPDDVKDEWLAYFTKETYEGHPLPTGKITLSDHQSKAGSWARLIGERTGLPQKYIQALVEAAESHDQGKKVSIWQSYAKNDSIEPLAKSDEYDDPRTLKGYRHELGSVLELPQDTSDLVAHLVASHHGYARPVYPDKASNPEKLLESRKEMESAPLRFIGLQKELGWWALAYLEALLKSADSITSKVVKVA